MKEQIDLRRFLRAKQHFLANQDRVFDLWVTALCNVLGGSIKAIAANSRRRQADPHGPLYSLLAEPGIVVDKIIGTL